MRPACVSSRPGTATPRRRYVLQDQTDVQDRFPRIRRCARNRLEPNLSLADRLLELTSGLAPIRLARAMQVEGAAAGQGGLGFFKTLVPGMSAMRLAVSVLTFSLCFTGLNTFVRAGENPPAPPAYDAAGGATTPAAAPAGTAPATQPVRVPDLNGDWCGSWQSCTNGHKGPMRASFCRLCDGNYEVTFSGRFCKLIPFRYKTTLTVTGHSDGVVYLSGSQNLGPLFGTFSYNAWANDCQFVSGYCSKKDQGQFVLSR